MSATESARARVRRFAVAVLLAGFTLLIVWPGHIVALPFAMVAAFGGGTPGVFVAEQRAPSKGESWIGPFRSEDGTVVLPSVRVDPGWGSFAVGQSVPATYTPLPDLWFVPGNEVHPRSGSTDWAYPAVTVAVWTGFLAWTALRLRRRLQHAGLLRPRIPRRAAATPPCSCADPSRCQHG
jgi:hypothetical protein